ncbi:hypothetical protein CEP51_008335 [Fusarium floridanum]|uniref:Uncharacterized protein n=1 Tax=Fusarium floridanum TaxID=1325733 RepID=A0A428RL97_9HYPO|nr:hypothetical protein CEP51_008335 [Fusarium floridanum]
MSARWLQLALQINNFIQSTKALFYLLTSALSPRAQFIFTEVLQDSIVFLGSLTTELAGHHTPPFSSRIPSPVRTINMDSTVDYMWRCHGCFQENVLDHCPSCFNCAHIRCGYCEVYLNPVKNAPKPPAPTPMWTCCNCGLDNCLTTTTSCMGCSHYFDNTCQTHWAYAQG